MKTETNSSSLSSQFAAWRKRQSAAKVGALALCSLSTLRAVENMETESAAAFASEKVTERQTDDNTSAGDEFTVAGPSIAPEIDAAPVGLGCLLSRAEREELESIRPASVAVVFRKSAAPVADVSEPLLADFVPEIVPDFAPALFAVTLSPEELAEISREVGEELAEIDAAEKEAASIAFANAFRSDWKPRFAPVDYAPAAAPVVTTAPAAPSEMNFDALRAAILSRPASRRRAAVSTL